MVLKMSFLKFSIIDILFGDKTFIYKAIPTIQYIQIINKTDVVIIVFDAKSKKYCAYGY